MEPYQRMTRAFLVCQIAIDGSDAGGLEMQLRPAERSSLASQSKERCLHMLSGFTQTLLQLPVGSKEGVGGCHSDMCSTTSWLCGIGMGYVLA